MPTAKITQLIDQSMSTAIGEHIADETIGFPILQWMARTNEELPPWWSFSRDADLRKLWKKSSHLSMIMYTAQTILVGTPLRIEAKDPSITSHVDQASFLTDVLMNVSEFGQSFYVARRKFIEDYLGTDNGGFMEVIGDGSPDGPIEGFPLAVRHLDSQYCWRTSNREYPVVYHDPYDGRAYKLHRSRVIYMSQMTSPITIMNGVGFSAVSRAAQVAQHLYDIYVYKQEKLGSRPISKILVGSGFKGAHIMRAVQAANVAMDNQGLSRYGRVVGIGTEETNASIDALDLNDFDPFEEETAVTLAVYGLVSAFGIPIQEVWPASAGRTGRSGDIQESRQRGKLPAEFHPELGLQIDQKYLPPYLRTVFDWRDDYQDERQGINRDIRARNRERDLDDGAVTVRIAREQMVETGDATRNQFATMELEAGRLEDGRPIAVLFYTNDAVISDILDLGTDTPTDTLVNDRDTMISAISRQRALAHAALASTQANRTRSKLLQALAALDWLQGQYQASAIMVATSENAEELEEPGEEEEAPEGGGAEDEEPNEDEGGRGPREPDEVREGTLTDAIKMDSSKTNEDVDYTTSGSGPW